MTPIAAKFEALAARHEKALVLFIVGGDPPLDQLPGILEALGEGGADIVEIGIPFSDPIADGPTIQAASQRALDRGVTPAAICQALTRGKWATPLVAMGYYNSILRIGLGNAASALKEAGFSGSIISDLTPEEATDWCGASWQNGLDNIFLAAPTSDKARVEAICRRASGFVYAVSRMGVTDQNVAAPPEALDLVRRIRTCTSLPVCVGFGVSTPQSVRMVCQEAEGAVVGSALVELLARAWDRGRGRARLVEFVRELKSGAKP